MMLPLAARIRTWYFLLGSLALAAPLLLAGSPVEQTVAKDEALAKFRKHYGRGHYASIQSVLLNSRPYVIALWHEGGHAVFLSADIFEYIGVHGQNEFRKVYSGDVSEEIIGLYAFSVDGSGREQLLILSNSAQIKILRILEHRQPDVMKLVFENGGKDISLNKESREIWIKNSVGHKIEVYQWDKQAGEVRLLRRVDILF